MDLSNAVSLSAFDQLSLFNRMLQGTYSSRSDTGWDGVAFGLAEAAIDIPRGQPSWALSD